MGFLSACSIGEIEFNKMCDGEFTKELYANIPGIAPEDITFEFEENTPYDDIFHMKISCNTRVSETDYIHYYSMFEIDKREFYGYDYFSNNGTLKLILYKQPKKNVNRIGFGEKFTPRYKKEEQL